jgi:hypothetical protein
MGQEDQLFKLCSFRDVMSYKECHGKTGCHNVKWTDLVPERIQWWNFVTTVMNLLVPLQNNS